MLPSVAIVILNWNGRAFLEKFLPYVVRYSTNATIVVADNNSTDDSIEFVKTNYPQLTCIKNAFNSGYAAGYNEALSKVTADYYVLLNSDVEVTENWLMPVITLMEHDKKIAACQPKLLDYNNRHLFEYAGAAGGFIDKYGYPFCRGRIFNHLEEDHQQYDTTMEIFWATGACMFVRSSAFWEVNGFDGDYFAHMEEIDLCWRLKNIGYTIYVEPQSVIYHVGGGTLNKLSSRKTFLNFRNNLTTLTKNDPSPFFILKIIYRLVLDGIAACKFLSEGQLSHFLAVIKAHFNFYYWLPKTLQKRKKCRHHQKYTNKTVSVYPKNIVFAFYLKRITRFSDLLWK